MTQTQKALHTRLVDATKNHTADCPSTFEFDPDAVEISGVVPGPARGLYALRHELADEIKALEQQMAALKATAKAAHLMAQQITLDAYPEVNDRQGFALCNDWTFFATGPSDERRDARKNQDAVRQKYETEMQRKDFGDEVVGDDDPDGHDFGDLMRSMMAGAHAH